MPSHICKYSKTSKPILTGFNAVGVLLLAGIWTGASASEAANPKRHTLTPEDIRNTFVGQVATDGTHWSYLFKSNGSISAVELGRQRKGRWAIRHKKLCLSVPEMAPEDCWLVIQEGGKLIFRRDGLDVVDVTIEAPSGYQLEWLRR